VAAILQQATINNSPRPHVVKPFYIKSISKPGLEDVARSILSIWHVSAAQSATAPADVVTVVAAQGFDDKQKITG